MTRPLYPLRGLGVEQHRLVKIEYEGMVFTHADRRLGAHTRRQFLSGGTNHHVGVSAGRLDDFDRSIERGDRARVPIDALGVVDRFWPNAEDDLSSVGEFCSIPAGGGGQDDWRVIVALQDDLARAVGASHFPRASSSQASP